MSEANKALIRQWFEEVWTNRRADAIDGMLAPDARIHGLGADEQGPADFKAFHAAYCDAFPDVTIRVEDVIAEGDMVAARWAGTATHRGNGLGFAATHRQARFGGMTFARIEGGKIVEGWNNFDQLGMFQQLGVLNLPASR